MREHIGLYRGKRKDNGEWVQGFYISHLAAAHYIIPCRMGGYVAMDNSFYVHKWYDVDPDTVGECTGLTDKNGKLIFEGDVVEGHCHSRWSHRLQRCVVAYSRDGFEARNHLDGLDSEYYTYRVLFSKDVSVIGNVHDNPELLGGGDNG